ncbi:MAG: trypsin-like peptidase domain-containing protein [Deltaproteobacteria bacterium]|nr:trypsin-like peptidase domain-containing protein [Deltaproteobacteria bacterium]
MKTMPLSSQYTFHSSGMIVLILAAVFLFGCTTVAPDSGKMGKDLVSDEDPVFDKRFRDLSFKDLDLRRLWIERGPKETREDVPIHNNTFAEITDACRHGVVNIYTNRLEEKEARFGLSPNDILPFRIPIISNLFDVIPFKVPIPYRDKGFSLGSGFIISEQGYILTNAHVIHNATDIRVVLSAGKREYPAKIIGADRITDTALVKIEPDHLLPVLPLGDSDALRVGEMVLAIGNPLGLRHSVTFGIVSAKERVTPMLNEDLVDFIQTDSAINPGSSGGPLLNFYGEVVGINTAVVSQAQSIGFAIPINTVKDVMPMLVLGKTERGWFGVRAAPLTGKKASEMGYPDDGGILVLEVDKGSPAQKAGIQPDDIIVKLNGQPLGSFLLFRRKLLSLTPGHDIHLTLFRGGKTREIWSTLGKKVPDK